jgi:ABC-type uncharacterized transport system fused permease/ATPase subunit
MAAKLFTARFPYRFVLPLSVGLLLAVSSEMEMRLFRLCQKMKITYITISHRPALQQFHGNAIGIVSLPEYRHTAIQQNSKTAKQQNGKTAKQQ